MSREKKKSSEIDSKKSADLPETKEKAKPLGKLKVVVSDDSNQALQAQGAKGNELIPEGESQSDDIEFMDPESLAARWWLENKPIIRELHRAFVRQVIFFTKPEGGSMTMEDAIKLASRAMDGPEAEDYHKMISSWSVENVSWISLDQLFRYDPTVAQQFWEDLKEEADKDFKEGHFAAKIFENTEMQNSPWKRAHFIAIRDSFIEQFKPQGGIDYSMIDMLAVTFTLWMYWTQVHTLRATTEATRTLTDLEKAYVKVNGDWIPPRMSEQEAIEQAAQLADRWRRAYQATLRQMRDWRRYSTPVTINNPGQVNIAADGGQQINAVKVEEK